MSSLIIYFSHAGENYFGGDLKVIEKGNTEVIADFIREDTGADIFKVEELNAYPQDYMKCIEVAKKEHEDNARPELKNALTDIGEYKTLYIGFPMLMFTQLESLDFTGKTVKPFVTHEGSGFGSSLKDLKKLCEGADIKKGLSIQGSKVNDAEDIVKHWVNE